MATMQQERLRPLTAAERRELEALVKASSERVDRVRRATAVLAVAEGQAFSVAAQVAGYRSPQAVTYLVRRFNRVGLGALEIAAGRGRLAEWCPTGSRLGDRLVRPGLVLAPDRDAGRLG